MKRYWKTALWLVLAWPNVGLCAEEGGAGPTAWPTPRGDRPCYIIAHRGVSAMAPENTLPAYQKAIDLGLDYIEVDLRTSKDGHLFVLHNNTLDKTTNESGPAKDFVWETLRKLDAGSWFSAEFAGTRLPDFEAVLRLARGKIDLYLDMKDADTHRVVEALRKYDMLDHVVVYANGSQLEEITRLAPRVKIMPEGYDAARTERVLRRFRPRVMAYTWRGFSEECVQKCHAEGVKVFVDVLGEGDNPEGMNRALDWGTDGIQTDHPDLMLKVLAERRPRP